MTESPQFSPHGSAGNAKNPGDNPQPDESLQEWDWEELDWVMPVVIAASAVVLFLAVAGWWGPLVPLLVFAGLVWLPVAAAVVWASSSSAKPRDLAVVVGMLGLFAVPMIAWSVDAYRGAMLWFGDEVLEASTALQAIDDPSHNVALAACKRQMESGDSTGRTWLVRTLEQRPGVAVQCLNSVDDEHRAMVLRVGNELIDIWYDGWMGAEQVDESLNCSRADHAAGLAAVVGGDLRAELLMCALESNSQATAQCCGRAATEIARNSGVDNVNPAGWTQPIQQPLLEALSDVIDVPPSTLNSEDPLVGTVGWRPADLWMWTTTLGCYRVTDYADVDGAGSSLVEMTRRQCGIDAEDPRRSTTARRAIQRSCSMVAADQQRLDIDRWCQITDRVHSQLAIGQAQGIVARAQLGAESEVLGRQMLDHFSGGAQISPDTPVYVSDGQGGIKLNPEVAHSLSGDGAPPWSAGANRPREFGDSVDEQYRRRHEIRREIERQTRRGERYMTNDPETRRQIREHQEDVEEALREVERYRRQGAR